MNISHGGVANETTVNSGGTMFGSTGGILGNTTLSSGGTLTAKGPLTLAEGAVFSAYDGAVIGQSLSEAGDRLDVAAYLSKAARNLPLVLAGEDNWPDIEYHAERCGIRSFIPVPFFRQTLEESLAAAVSDGGGEGGGSEFPDLTGRRLLLAEDNLINREIALEILGMTGAEVDAAENGEEAVRLFELSEPGTYSLILMDVQMPVMNGYEATGKIRALSRSDAGSVPIYAMTANTFAEDVARAREAGMNGHIAKPIDINALMQVLRQVRK